MNHTIHNLLRTTRGFLRDEDAAAATEYAAILGILVVTAVAGAAMFGLHFGSTTSAVYSGLSTGADAAGTGSFGPGNFRNHTSFSFP